MFDELHLQSNTRSLFMYRNILVVDCYFVFLTIKLRTSTYKFSIRAKRQNTYFQKGRKFESILVWFWIVSVQKFWVGWVNIN